VRSAPFSKRAPHFSQEDLQFLLREVGVKYIFLGNQLGGLGGRPRTKSLYTYGVADYDAMAATREFADGVRELLSLSSRYRIAMLCSERDPLHCHRCLLVGRHLAAGEIHVGHIHHDGNIETHRMAEERLLHEEKLLAGDLLRPRSEQLMEAYARRAQRVAFSTAQPRTRAAE
jgi:uncharacterized protein (DUF488 family)